MHENINGTGNCKLPFLESRVRAELAGVSKLDSYKWRYRLTLQRCRREMIYRRELGSFTPSPSAERAGLSQSTINSSKLFNCIISTLFVVVVVVFLRLHDFLCFVRFFFLFDLKFFRITFCVSVRNCVLVSGVIFDLRFPNWGMEAVRFVFEVMLEYFDWLFGLLSSGEEFWPVVWLFGVICRRNVPKHLNCCFVFVWTLIVCAFSLWFYASALIVTRRR